MKRAFALAAAVLAAAVCTPAPARAWDELGHRVVARIAWEAMTPQARANAVALLRDAPEESGLPLPLRRGMWPDSIRDREFFVEAAVWSDIVRDRDFVGNPFHRSSWHYVNYFWRQDRPGGPAIVVDRAPAGDLVLKLTEFSQSVGSAGVPRPERAVQLAWLLHQVGDIHQPMHTSARITAESPEGDRGANDFALGERWNLHSFWDGAVTRNVRWSAVDRGLPWLYVGRLATSFMLETPAPRVTSEVPPAPAAEWARESFAAAQTLYPASLRRNQRPPESYDRMAARLSAQRVALAGHRLGHLLNRTLGQ